MPDTTDVAKEVRDVLDLRSADAIPDGTPTHRVVARWIDEISDVVGAIAEKIADDDREALAGPATEAALAFWDEVFVPIDLPVNNFLERIIEQQGRAMIPGLVASAFSRPVAA